MNGGNRAVRNFVAGFLIVTMLVQPVFALAGGAVTVESGGYSVGEAFGELYPFVNVDTGRAVPVISSGGLTQTHRTSSLAVASDNLPSGAALPTAQAQNSIKGAPPTGSIAPAGYALDTYSDAMPQGALAAKPQALNLTASQRPAGAIDTAARNFASASTATAPQGAAAVSAQTKDSTRTTAPAGIGNVPPTAIGNGPAGAIPNGAQASTMNSDGGAGSTTAQPNGAANIQTRTINAANGNLAIDIDGNGAVNVVNFQLTDTNIDGDYNDMGDTMSISANDADYVDGGNNNQVDTAGAGDDEVFMNPMMGYDIWFDNNAPANRVEFRFDFGGLVNAPWVTVTNRRWYTDGAAGWVNTDNDYNLENMMYAVTDTNSDGIYDTLDMSVNDFDFWDGANNDGILDGGNDERAVLNGVVQIGATPNRYSFTVFLATDPQESDPDMGITSLDWFQGSYAIDADADGAADDTLNYALGDTNSNGLFETIELSTDDATFGETLATADVTGANEDEQDNNDNDRTCQLGTYNFEHLYAEGGNTYGFDHTPDGAGDFSLRALDWWSATFLLDTDQDGLADDNVYGILSDQNSEGLYERMDISLSATFNGGNRGDGIVVNNNDETAGALTFNNLVYTSGSDTRVVYNDFRMSFVNNPANANVLTDLRLTANYYTGTFTLDVDANGGANDIVSYAISDTQSDGRAETVDWSVDGAQYGTGALADKLVANGNDEKDAGVEGAAVVSVTTALRLGVYNFGTTHTYYPGSLANDVSIITLEWFTGNFSIDVDGTGTARNVAVSVADTNSDGLYETIDMSSDDAVFYEDPAHVSNGALELPGIGNDDERSNGAEVVLIKTYSFLIEFDRNPGWDAFDARATAQEWFCGAWSVDIDGDGLLDIVNAALDDTDSNGLYDTLELSADDGTFGEGVQSNALLRVNDDERLTLAAQVKLGIHSFNVTFDSNPAGDASDCVIKAREAYTGQLYLDSNADGIAGDRLHFSLDDSDSNGLYDTLELSLNDGTFGEGTTDDGIVGLGDDEVLAPPGEARVGGLLYAFDIDSSPSSGVRDAVMESLTLWTGTMLIEGTARDAAAADGNSDGIYDTLYIDLDGDNVYGDCGALRVGGTISSPALLLAYDVLAIDHAGASATIAPSGLAPGQATGWSVGTVKAGGVGYTVALSDRDGDGANETADFDADRDGILDDTGNTAGTLSTVTLGGTGHQVMNLSADGSAVRLVAYTAAALGPANDVSQGGSFRAGTLSEAASGADANGDGDTIDTFSVLLADPTAPKVFTAMFLDRDGDLSLVSEPRLAQEDAVELGIADFIVDRISQDGSGASLRQTNMPAASGKSGSDGLLTLGVPHDGLYWLKVTGTAAAWGFRTYNGTNSGYGLYMMAGTATISASLVKGGFEVSGKITDSASSEAVSGVLVEVYSQAGSLVMSSLSRSDGTYRVMAAAGSGYSVVFTKAGYITDDGRAGGTLGGLGLSSDATGKNIALKKDTVAPSLTLRKPADGEILSGTVEVAADASDNFKLAAVEVSTNMGDSWALMIGIGTNYTYLWATQAGPDGEYRVTVRARDPGGLATYKHSTVYVGNERIPPTLRISQPMDGKNCAGLVTISAQASDASGLRKVLASINDSTGKVVKEVSLWTEGTLGTYTGLLDTLRLVDGAYSIVITAWDMANNSASGTINIKVDNTPPQLAKFAAGDKEKVRIQAVFTEATSIRAVWLSIDGGAWKEMSRKDGLTYTYDWQTKEDDNGAHNIELRVTDSLGNEARYTKPVQINNTPWSIILGVLVLVLVFVAFGIMAFSGRKKKAVDDVPAEPVEPAAYQSHATTHHKRTGEPAGGQAPKDEPAEEPKAERTESTEELEKVVSNLK